MGSFAFDFKNLKSGVKVSDIFAHELKDKPDELDQIINDAVELARNGFNRLSLKSARVRNNYLYQFKRLHEELVIRKLGRNIKKLTRVRQSNRDYIIKSLQAILEESHAFRIYRIDIKSFFESVDRELISEKLSKDSAFPNTSMKIWRSLHESLTGAGIIGLPRGLAISTVLSEYLLRDFDTKSSNSENVYFYSRFVDDIIIVTTGKEDAKLFESKLFDFLPKGLTFNSSKTKTIEVKGKRPTGSITPMPQLILDFLGYEFSIDEFVTDFRKKRQIRIDIAFKKVKKIKTKVVLSLRQYVVDGNFQLLIKRLQMISGNYQLYKNLSTEKFNVGIYYNYKFVNSETSLALKNLDKFIPAIIKNNGGDLSSELNRSLSAGQMERLLTISFQKSFNNRIFYNFAPNEMTKLKGVWKYA